MGKMRPGTLCAVCWKPTRWACDDDHSSDPSEMRHRAVCSEHRVWVEMPPGGPKTVLCLRHFDAYVLDPTAGPMAVIDDPGD